MTRPAPTSREVPMHTSVLHAGPHSLARLVCEAIADLRQQGIRPGSVSIAMRAERSPRLVRRALADLISRGVVCRDPSDGGYALVRVAA